MIGARILINMINIRRSVTVRFGGEAAMTAPMDTIVTRPGTNEG
jgi:hypothetical protein